MTLELLNKAERKVYESAVNRKHDCIFYNTCRKKYHKSFAVQHGYPQCIETTVHYKFYNEFSKYDTPDLQWLFVEKGSENNTGKHGIKGKTKKEWAGWFDQIFENIQCTAKDTAGNRTKEKFYDSIGQS